MNSNEQKLTSIKEIPSISGVLSYSQTQVDAGIIMYEGPEAKGMASMLYSQEARGPLAIAKSATVLDGDKLVFCEQPGEAYTALYFYTAGYLDAIFAISQDKA